MLSSIWFENDKKYKNHLQALCWCCHMTADSCSCSPQPDAIGRAEKAASVRRALTVSPWPHALMPLSSVTANLPITAQYQLHWPIAAQYQLHQPITAQYQLHRPIAAQYQLHRPIAAQYQLHQPIAAQYQLHRPIAARNRLNGCVYYRCDGLI